MHDTCRIGVAPPGVPLGGQRRQFKNHVPESRINLKSQNFLEKPFTTFAPSGDTSTAHLMCAKGKKCIAVSMWFIAFGVFHYCLY